MTIQPKTLNAAAVAEAIGNRAGFKPMHRLPWRIEAGTSFEIRVSHLLKVFCVWVVVMVFTGIFFHSRIRSLETERNELVREVTGLKRELNSLTERIGYGENQEESGRRVKRTPERTERSPFNASNNGARAAYMQIDGLSVNIRKPRQVIGPWYLPEEGNEIGFSDMWYNNLSLDSNGTSVVFQEGGLFLIYAQVFYQMQQVHNVNPNPMGYRIHLKKYNNGRRSRKPITIAECVPSFPATLYQTCFTQVAWFVEPQDEIFLEHFTESKPMIEALRTGQTFLGIVQLSQ